MTDYTANACASTVQPRSGVSIESVTSAFTVAVALVATDTIKLVQVPAGACIQEIILSASGSLGSTFTVTVGDGASANRYYTAAVFGQGAASLVRLTNAAGHGYVYTSDDTIDLVVATAAAGTTGVVITTTVIYTLQPVL